MRYNITALFFCIDEFCKAFEEWEKHRLIDTGRKRHRSCEMTLSEMLTIMVLFHVNPCKIFNISILPTLSKGMLKSFQTWLATIDLGNLCPVFLFLYVYCCRVCLEKRLGFILLTPQLCLYVTTSVSIEIVFLRDLQGEEKQPWDGFLVSSSIW